MFSKRRLPECPYDDCSRPIATGSRQWCDRQVLRSLPRPLRGPSSPNDDSMRLRCFPLSPKGVREGLAIFLLLLPAGALPVDFPVRSPSPEMFRRHREQFLGKLPANAVAILHAAPGRLFSNDTNYTYRQDSNFYYLTGIEEPGTIALFRPSSPDGKRYILYVRPRDARREAYEGPRLTVEAATKQRGADAAFPVAEFEGSLWRGESTASRAPSGYLVGAEAIYLSDGGDAEWAEKLRGQLERLRASDAAPATTVDARAIVREMRLVKDTDEIALLRHAAE